MKIFSQFELEQFEAYPILKRILNDAEIQVFFNTPQEKRGTLIPTKRVVKVLSKPLQPNELRLTAPPKTIPMIIGTQMCTKDSIYAMAMEYMNKDFTWNGVIYNMNKLGWRFEFHNKKTALGTCKFSYFRKCGFIQLSQWIIENSQESYDKWVNTMLHEIAHAIDYVHYGSSSHDYRWQAIARSIGCDAERTTNVEYTDLIKNPISKYTLTCPNGHTTPSHKIKSGRSSCRKCGDEHGITGFNSRFLITQIQNW